MFLPACLFICFSVWYHLLAPDSAAGICAVAMVGLMPVLAAFHGVGTLVAVAFVASKPRPSEGAGLALPDDKPDGPLRPADAPGSRPSRRRLDFAAAFAWACGRSKDYLLTEGYVLSTSIALGLAAYGRWGGEGLVDPLHHALQDAGLAYLAAIVLSTPAIPRLRKRSLERKPLP
jgi:hypothetical protein